MSDAPAAGPDDAATGREGDAPAREEPADGPGGLTGWIRGLGRFGFSAARHAGRSGILLAATILALRKPRRYVSEAFVQAKQMGVDSLALVLLVGALSGSVLAQQSGYQFTTLPMWIVGQAVAAGMLTELAPVLTAIVARPSASTRSTRSPDG